MHRQENEDKQYINRTPNIPKIPPFQGGENVVRLTLGWVIDRSFTPAAQQVAPSQLPTGVVVPVVSSQEYR